MSGVCKIAKGKYQAGSEYTDLGVFIIRDKGFKGLSCTWLHFFKVLKVSSFGISSYLKCLSLSCCGWKCNSSRVSDFTSQPGRGEKLQEPYRGCLGGSDMSHSHKKWGPTSPGLFPPSLHWDTYRMRNLSRGRRLSPKVSWTMKWTSINQHPIIVSHCWQTITMLK